MHPYRESDTRSADPSKPENRMKHDWEKKFVPRITRGGGEYQQPIWTCKACRLESHSDPEASHKLLARVSPIVVMGHSMIDHVKRTAPIHFVLTGDCRGGH